ncbi:MAG: nascent polypeptide-associated complex protein [Candidatus Bathyarchaeia archaeon]
MAYKALKAARGAPSGRNAMRMMQKMGMKVDEIPAVSKVIIKTAGKDIVIEEPNVTLVTVQGQAMYQIAGGRLSESSTETPIQTAPLESDVQLVAQQTGRSLEEAGKALAEASGDLAKAILTLKGQTSTG